MKKILLVLSVLIVALVVGIFFLNTVVPSEPVPLLPESSTTTPNKIIESSISIIPKNILPGDPIFVTIDSVSSTTRLLYDKKPVPFFSYEGKEHAFIAVDFNEKASTHTLEATFADGSVATTSVTVSTRPKIEAPLGIPEKLGGNTPQAASQLLTNLAKENNILNTVLSSSTILWGKAFQYPLETIFITDDYGYDRLTVNSTIVHKGTDFRAPEGTKVLAMNDGVVKVARTFVVYGNSVIIDHGLGVQTLYMHLSKLNVKEGDRVTAGQLIGLSGMTGYAESPHLHISVKISGISIDPMTFIRFFVD